MSKIVFFNSTMGLGGVARVITIWGNFFIDKGFDVEVVSNENKPSFYKLDKKIKHEILDINKFGKKDKVVIFFKLFFFLRKRKNQTLIFNKSHYVAYLLILKKFRLIHKSNKLVYFIHGSDSNLKAHYNNLKKIMIVFTFDKVIALIKNYNNYDLKIKKSTKRYLVDIFLPDKSEDILKKIVYIPNPLSFKSEIFANQSNKNILSISRFDVNKGHHLLIEAWMKICDNHKNWNLLIYGEGEEKENLIKLIKKHNKLSVKLLPPIKDVKPVFINSSIYVNTSKEEGFGMPILEAMECGLPVISFDNVGAKNLIINNKNGLLVENQNIEKLSSVIDTLIRDKELRVFYGKNSKKFAIKYHIENLYPKWNKILS